MIAGGICRKSGLYYCSQCVTEDIEKYGEPFIHREHQLQGIEYCAHHELKLKKYIKNPRLVSNCEYIRFDKRKMDMDLTSKTKHDEIAILQIKLAKMAYQLLQISINNFSRECIKLRYRTLFREHNLLTLRNTVRLKKLYKAFELKFPKGFLDKYECSLDINDSYNWLRIITRDVNRHVHPFRHILMIYFLNHDIESFFLVTPDQGPYGLGPWPCLNKASIHYMQNVVNELRIKRDYYSKNPVGEFSCSCGYVYVRKGTDKMNDDRYRKNSVKEYGEIWRTKVKNLHKKGLSARKIAELLDESPATVRKYLLKGKKTKVNVSETQETLIERYRMELLEVMRQFPNYNRTDLLTEFRKVYRFLSKYDKEWFNANVPAKKKMVQVKSVDWNKRDEEYYEKIKKLYDELLVLDKPVRITRSIIGKKLDIFRGIQKDRVSKMPNTEKLLNKITESVQEFQIRRCKKIIDLLLRDGNPIYISQIKGGTRWEHFKEIRVELEDYINSKQSNNNPS